LFLLSSSSSSLISSTSCPWFESNFWLSSYFPDPCSDYVQDDYMLLYNILGHSDWFCVPNVNAVDPAVYTFAALVLEGINLAILYVRSRNLAFPHRYFNSLTFYIKKKNRCFRTAVANRWSTDHWWSARKFWWSVEKFGHYLQFLCLLYCFIVLLYYFKQAATKSH
jgi:hypothetical protein